MQTWSVKPYIKKHVYFILKRQSFIQIHVLQIKSISLLNSFFNLFNLETKILDFTCHNYFVSCFHFKNFLYFSIFSAEQRVFEILRKYIMASDVEDSVSLLFFFSLKKNYIVQLEILSTGISYSMNSVILPIYSKPTSVLFIATFICFLQMVN